MREEILRRLSALRERYDAELRDLIVESARLGVKSEDIARALATSRATLWRRYGTELRRGTAAAGRKTRGT